MSDVQLIDGAANCPFRRLAGANDQAGRMRRSRYQKSIADRIDRRRVNHDPIEFTKQTLDDILELLITKKLGRVRCATTGRQDDEIVVLGRSDSVLQVNLSAEQIC